MSGRQRFLLRNTHYSLAPANGDATIIREPNTLQLCVDTEVVAFPCCWEQIQHILRQLRELEVVIRNNTNEEEQNTLAEQLLELKRRLREFLGNPDDNSWRSFAVGTGVASLVAGASTPAAVVATIQSIGFTAGGIGAGTTAASMMAAGGAFTPAGGMVATCQSIGALGYLGITATVVAAAAGTVMSAGAIAVGYNYFKKGRTEETPNVPDNCWRICYDRFHSNLR